MLKFSCFFSPQIWGTVSDWGIVLATTVSLIFLNRTLRSQLKVQQMQLKSLNIENARFLKDQNLSLPVEIISFIPYKHGEVSFRIEFVLSILVENANFSKLDISFDRDVILGLDMKQEYLNLFTGDQIRYKFSIDLPYNQYLDEQSEVQLQLDVIDYADNNLRKIVFLSFKDGIYGISDRGNGFERLPE